MPNPEADPFDRILLYTIKRSGTLPGKKVIQKLVYFLKEAGLPVRFRFRWDKWGPYSQELADYVDDLAAEGLVKSTPTPVPFSHEGTSGVQYNYSLTSKGNETVPKLTPSNEEVEKISRIFKLVKEVSWQNLELYASVHYLVKFYSTRSDKMALPEGLDDLMEVYKPGRFSSQDVRAVYYVLKNHGLL